MYRKLFHLFTKVLFLFEFEAEPNKKLKNFDLPRKKLKIYINLSKIIIIIVICMLGRIYLAILKLYIFLIQPTNKIKQIKCLNTRRMHR